MSTVVVVGLGYVGLPLAMRACEVGHHVVGLRRGRGPGEAARGRGVLHRGRARRGPEAGPGERPVPCRLPTRPRAPVSTSRSWPCRRRCATACPTSPTSRTPPARSARYLRAGRDRGRSSRPRTPAPPRRWCADAGGGLRADRPGADFHLGFSPERIDPGNPTWTLVTTPKIVSGHRRGLAAGGQGVLRHDRGHDRGGLLAARGRAGQAGGEHLPAREHRAGQRDGDVRPRPRTSTSGRRSTRRPPSRSGSCSSPRARASAATACRSTRPTCRGGCSARSARASGSSSWPTTSTATCRTTWCAGS